MLILWQYLSYIIVVCFSATTIRSLITDGTTSMTGLSSFFDDRNELDDDVDVVNDNNEDDGDNT